MRRLGPVLAVLGGVAGCAGPPPDDPRATLGGSRPVGAPASTARMYDRICPDGTTTFGVDVSYWQGTVDWSRAASAGVEFAFVRVSYGLQVYDTQFTSNWSGTRAQGIVRGAYQYFLGDDDPVEQAELLIDEMGGLQEGDLPPVLDVESYGNEGVSTATMRAGIAAWIDAVEAELGVRPIIYTSVGNWSALTGDWDPGDVHLWVANWEVSCPYVPDAWDGWAFWQYTDAESVAGIGDAVDGDVFNGSLADLEAWAATWGGGGGGGGGDDETCTGECTVAAGGVTVVEEDDPCGCPTGDPSALHDTGGHDDHAWWTEADVPEPDYAEGINWLLRFEAGGDYVVHAWVPNLDALTTRARYKVFHGDGADYAIVDQSAGAGGWVRLGTFRFEAGGDQWVRLGDNYDDGADMGRKVALDALRFEPVAGGEDDTAGGGGIDTGAGGTDDQPVDDCTCDPGETRTMLCTDGGTRTKTCDGCDWGDWSPCEGGGEPGGCACSAAGTAPGALLGLLPVALGALARRRGRRESA